MLKRFSPNGLESVGVPLTMIGSIYVAWYGPETNFFYLYIIFWVGSLLIGIASHLRQTHWIFALNVFFLMVNTIGIIRAWS
ncbi:MAG: hypothetical protein HQM07_00610 [Zetaproteobacteria bacterium]|nr:hypothetical protein [Zetaproteobacteria bacterium]